MRVYICGVPHEVIECDDKFNSEVHLGMIDFQMARIFINREMSPEMKDETLCHEILHGILTHIGREDLSEQEEFVTVMGNAIYQTFSIKKEMGAEERGGGFCE